MSLMKVGKAEWRNYFPLHLHGECRPRCGLADFYRRAARPLAGSSAENLKEGLSGVGGGVVDFIERCPAARSTCAELLGD